jgi:hypothetical protein
MPERRTRPASHGTNPPPAGTRRMNPKRTLTLAVLLTAITLTGCTTPGQSQSPSASSPRPSTGATTAPPCTDLTINDDTTALARAELLTVVALNGHGTATVHTGQADTFVTTTTGDVTVGPWDHLSTGTNLTVVPSSVTLTQVADALNANSTATTSLDGPVYPSTATNNASATLTIDGPTLIINSASPATVTFTGTCTTTTGTGPITGTATLYTNPITKTVICTTRSALRATNAYGPSITDWCLTADATT